MKLLRNCMIAALVCAAAFAAWQVFRAGDGSEELTDESTPPDPYPRDPGEELVHTWNQYARSAPFPQGQILYDPAEVVALMNKRSDGRVLDLHVLWQPGDPVPEGYQRNPHPKDWTAYDRELDEARAAPRWWEYEEPYFIGAWKVPTPPNYAPPTRLATPRKNTLFEQTGLYLWLYRYRTHLIDGKVLIFREDALIPPLVTKKLYFCDREAGSWYKTGLGPSAVLPKGRLDARRTLEDAALFLPGMSAVMDPRDGTLTLCLDQASMRRVLVSFDQRYDRYAPVTVDSSVARWKWRMKDDTRVLKEYLKKRFWP